MQHAERWSPPCDGAGRLSAESLELYRRDGYVVLPGFFGAAELQSWERRFLALIERREPVPPGMLVMRDVMVAKGKVHAVGVDATAKVQDLEGDEVLFGYSRHERLLNAVESLIGHDIMSVHTMLVNKPPGVDGRHPLHQDQHYFPFEPPDWIVAAWTAIQDCDRQNGCLRVIPGSHRLGLLNHELPPWEFVNGKYFGIVDHLRYGGGVHLEMRAGDVALFHPLLIHGSGRNRSARFRRAISTHFASCRCWANGKAHPLGERRYIVVRGHGGPEG